MFQSFTHIANILMFHQQVKNVFKYIYIDFYLEFIS